MQFPISITLETNPDKCNLNCVICDNHSPLNKNRLNQHEQEQMSEQLLSKILEEAIANKVEQVTPSTMGEPLLYQHFDLLHRYCKAGKIKMNITTNGTFPGRETDIWAQMLCEICSDIKVSMLGTDDATLKENMSGVKYDFLINGLKQLVEIRNNYYLLHKQYVTITLKVTFMKNILEKLEELVETAWKIGIDRVRGHFLLPLYDEIKDQDIKSNKNLIESWNQISSRIKQKMEGVKTISGRNFILDNFDPITLPKRETVEKKCPYLGNELVIKANGDAVSCCVPETVRFAIPVFGNLNEQTIKQIWNSELYQSFCINYLQTDICRTCELKV